MPVGWKFCDDLGCLAYNDVGLIAFVSGKMNSQTYQLVLGSHLLSNPEFLAEKNWKFQQGNASVLVNNSA